VSDARDVLGILEDDPSSKPARDELRRRLHALGTAARMLRLDALGQAIQQVLAVLDRAAQSGAMREEDVGFVGQVLDDLPALAWGEPAEREQSEASQRDKHVGSGPAAVLVVGAEKLAEALMDDSSQGARVYECECTEDTQSAIDLARAYAPDLILVDTEAPYAPELVEALLDDPLTEPVPVLVIGSFRTPEEAARYVALGVARAFPRPVAPETLRRACDELLDAREGRTMRITLGEPTLEQLANRLAEELRRAMLDSVDRPARSCRVPLGEGTEVLGALWGAIARVQEIVTTKTGGAVRFGGDAPEGAVALAPWLHQDLAAGDRLLVGRGRGAGADVRLEGRRVVVADDDPGVTWFITDLLRTAGCDVYEALDGNAALELAFRVQPDVVVSDILMPGIDGFALCRALRRDVALRDTPVILLSWKEDLLQRVRELGASAAAYMRKESDSRAILARTREVLRARARIEGRLKAQGEVRGRLDDLSPRLLLDLVCSIRKDARLAVRDAVHVYEIEIRGEAPRKVTRTASDGSFQSGERALAGLLGVGAGRFVVSSAHDPVRGDLTGTLFEQLVGPIAAARGALAATTGPQMMQVSRVLLERSSLVEYLGATPEPTRTLITRLAQGASPRQMLLSGESSPASLEEILADLAGRGAIRGVESAEGIDVLPPAVDSALAVLRSTPSRSGTRSSMPPKPTSERMRAAAPSPSVPPAAAPLLSPTIPPRLESRAAAPTLESMGPGALPASPQEEAAVGEAAPSSLEDAVMRELSDRSPHPAVARMTPAKGTIVEPSELRPRSNPPGSIEEESQDPIPLPSLPPDAIVPGAASGEDGGPIKIPPLAPGLPELTLADADVSLEPPAVEVHEATPEVARLTERASEETLSVPSLPTLPPTEVAEPTAPFQPLFDESPAKQPAATPPPATQGAHTDPRPVLPKRSFPWTFVAGAVALAAGAALASRLYVPAAGTAIVVGASSGSPSAIAATSATTAASVTTGEPSSEATSAEPDGIPLGAEVPPGFGLIVVTAPSAAKVRLDGAIAGAGPVASAVAAPGYHDVRVEEDEGKATDQVLEVRAGKATRWSPTPSP
jgi:CheY-like chemotaxis protein